MTGIEVPTAAAIKSAVTTALTPEVKLQIGKFALDQFIKKVKEAWARRNNKELSQGAEKRLSEVWRQLIADHADLSDLDELDDELDAILASGVKPSAVRKARDEVKSRRHQRNEVTSRRNATNTSNESSAYRMIKKARKKKTSAGKRRKKGGGKRAKKSGSGGRRRKK